VDDRRDPGAELAAIAALQRLVEVFQRRRAQLAAGAGLTEAQWHVLEEVGADAFMPSMFARRCQRSAPAVSRVVRQLLDKELIAPLPPRGDGRTRRYGLTAAGRRVLGGLRRSRQRAIDAVWADLDPGALAGFTRFSRELVARLERYAARHSA